MTESDYPAPSEQSFDFKKYVIRVFRNWYWILVSVLIGYGIATYINRYSTPQFSAKATIIINDERKSTAELLINALDRYSARRNIDNEIAILKSYRMAYRAISELDFKVLYHEKGKFRQSIRYKACPFRVVLDTSRFNAEEQPVQITLVSEQEYEVHFNGDSEIRKRLRYGEYFRNNAFNFTVYPVNPRFLSFPVKNFFFEVKNINQLSSDYSQKLSVSATDKRGTVLTMLSTGSDPRMESDYINKLMEVYIRSGLEEKNQTAINAINFIDSQLATVIDSLNQAESKMQGFKTQSKMMEISEEGQFLFNKVTDLQKNRAAMEVELRYYQYLQQYLDSKNDFSSVIAPSFIGITESPLAANLGQLVELYKERKTLMLSATKNNPAITVIDERIQSSIDALRENLSEAEKITGANLKELDYQMQSLEAEMVQLPSTERKLLNIQRAYKLNDQIYNFLLQKRADAAIARASSVADNKILDISRAENTEQISPMPGKNRIIGILGGLILPLLILFLIEFFNPVINDTNDIKRFTNAPLLGSIGHNDRDSEIPVFANPQSAIAEAFRGLRTNLQYYLRENGQKVVCVTSTISGEGKTFTSVNLAAIIAQAGKKTLLVSLDLRKPKIHRVFNLENKVGLSNYLIEKADFNTVITPTHIKNLFVTVAGPVPPNPAELIGTARMKEFITDARASFDIVILDTPPMAIVTDAMLLTKYADVNLFVVRANYSSTEVLKLVEELKVKEEIRQLGIVVNDIKYDSILYRSNYGYRYGYSYGYIYTKGHSYYGDAHDKAPTLFKQITDIIIPPFLQRKKKRKKR